jgi:hypothetical protein
MVCSHLTTSKPSTKSSQCRLISSTAFSLTAFDVFYARLYCSLGGSACSRRITTPLTSRATFLHIVALHAVQLLLRFQLPNRVCPALSRHSCARTRVFAPPGPTLAPAEPLAHAPTAPPASSARAPLNTCTRHRLPLRYRSHARATRSASLTFAPAPPANGSSTHSPARHHCELLHCQLRRSRVCVTPVRRQLAEHARVCSWAEPRPLPARQCASTRPRARARSRAPPRLPRTLRSCCRARLSLPRSTHHRAPSRATCSCPALAPASARPRARAACRRPAPHLSSARPNAEPPARSGAALARRPLPASALARPNTRARLGRHQPAPLA